MKGLHKEICAGPSTPWCIPMSPRGKIKHEFRNKTDHRIRLRFESHAKKVITQILQILDQ